MAPVLAQELNIAQLIQPLGIVDQKRLARLVAERQEAAQRARIPAMLAAMVASSSNCRLRPCPTDRRPSSCHRRQGDRAVPGALQPAQQHDAHEVADVQAIGGAVEADVRHQTVWAARVEPFEIGRLMEETAFDDSADELGGAGS